LPVMVVKLLLARSVAIGVLTYIYIPFVLFKSNIALGFVVSYLCQVSIFSTLTLFAILMNGDLAYWRMALGLPFAPLYNLAINWLPGAVGATMDALLFGNITGFAP